MNAAVHFKETKTDGSCDATLSGRRFLDTILHLDAALITGAQILAAVLARYYSLDQSTAMAETLMQEFGSVANVLHASAERVLALVEMSSDAWSTLQLMRKFAGVVLREPLDNGPLLNNLGAVHDYLTFMIGHEKHESCRILYLDNHKHLIKDEIHSTGSLTSTAIYPREIVVRACELKARAIIITHNHPSGDPRPSSDDCVMTTQIQGVCENIGVILYDHLIIGRDRYFSFRQAGLLG